MKCYVLDMGLLGKIGGGKFNGVKARLRAAADQAEAQIKKRIAALATPDPSPLVGFNPQTESTKHPENAAFSYGDVRKAVQVFGARTCPWSSRALRLLKSEGIEPVYLDLDHEASRAMRDELRNETGQASVPYVFLRGEFIGGFDALDEICRLGQLGYFVLPEAERSKHPDHGKFAVAKRV